MRLFFSAFLLFLTIQVNAEQSVSPMSSIRVTGQSTTTAIRQAVGSSGEIETQSCMLNPEYEFHDDGTRTLTDYIANNVMRVTLRPLPGTGQDARAVRAGAGRNAARAGYHRYQGERNAHSGSQRDVALG
jgi:uncharacterized protein YggE